MYSSYMDRVKWIWYLSPMRAAKVQASLRIRAVSPEPSLLAYTSSESRGTFRQKARSLAPLNGWACAVKICHDGMLKDTNSLDGAYMLQLSALWYWTKCLCGQWSTLNKIFLSDTLSTRNISMDTHSFFPGLCSFFILPLSLFSCFCHTKENQIWRTLRTKWRKRTSPWG